MLLCLSFIKRCSFIWDMNFPSLGTRSRCVTWPLFLTVHLCRRNNPFIWWIHGINSSHFVRLEKYTAFQPSGFTFHRLFWYNGIVLCPLRAGIWLRKSVDVFPTMWACAFLNVVTWSSSLKSSLKYYMGRNASQWPFMRNVAWSTAKMRLDHVLQAGMLLQWEKVYFLIAIWCKHFFGRDISKTIFFPFVSS